MKKRIFQKGLGYGMLFLIFILPMLLFAYFVQLRLFLIVPIVLYLVLFFNGVLVSDHDRMIEFEISREIRKQDE
ncbi:hypothetical protein [Streptococcus parasanguinis]|jgi:hypothetical protein|uniref:hypothetical protein n=1 Tax=Streptococcus parasanguinis TaxID=1318 RepID=UPI0021A88A68|nr:hypothetical protein [Streptococcus parasanguinis]MDB8616389.1 hypothetical protein [Streptococcus parasanguinis]MDB8622763.1 hypothetical protein [Streptococcus parasanguinis]